MLRRRPEGTWLDLGLATRVVVEAELDLHVANVVRKPSKNPFRVTSRAPAGEIEGFDFSSEWKGDGGRRTTVARVPPDRLACEVCLDRKRALVVKDFDRFLVDQL